MKKAVTVETTITVELSAQDVREYVEEKKLAPPEWEHYSVEVVGLTEGRANVVLNHIERRMTS